MRWLLRPSALLLISLALSLAAGWLMLPPRSDGNRPQPIAVGDDEQEVVWLYPATNASAWERFVSAVRFAADRQPEKWPRQALDVDYSKAFPPQTTAVSELTLSTPGVSGRLVFRWYKLTSEWTVGDWMKALLTRDKPPLAIIGGNASDVAMDMAQQLRAESGRLGARSPLLLVTTATTVKLNQSYPERIFRFCFNNARMAEAVTDFIWSQDDLRPDRAPVYVPIWDDDPYSDDLTTCFLDSLKGSAARLALAGPLPTPQHIFSSVGDFERPNREEAATAEYIIDELVKHKNQKRPLLVLPGQTGPSRRFLRALVRTAPRDSRKFVVASGDGIAFNTVYRDRNVLWPIQDLPFALVFFCHRNPVDEQAGFHSLGEHVPGSQDGSRSATGTEDLLLFVDIVEAIAQSALPGTAEAAAFPANADMLRERLRKIRHGTTGLTFSETAPLLFDPDGERRAGTGEHVVCIRPHVESGGRVLPEAGFAVWYWRAKAGEVASWHERRDLPHVLYEGGPTGDSEP